MSKKVRVLIADDSMVFRKIVRDTLEKIPSVEVVGEASDGRIALQRIEELKPDLITLDIEMPELNGLMVLKEIMAKGHDVKALMVSSMTKTGAYYTTQALELGAFDFVLKPSGDLASENIRKLRGELEPRIAAFQSQFGKGRKRRSPDTEPLHAPTRRSSSAITAAHAIDQNKNGNKTKSKSNAVNPNAAAKLASEVRAALSSHLRYRKKNHTKAEARRVCGIPQVIAIGCSTGGPAALTKVIPRLPADLPVPVLLVQHMPPVFTKTLADDLNNSSQITVAEANGGERLRPGSCYIAPGGKQMKVVKTGTGVFVRITDDPPVNSCRPSVDYLFRSVGKVYDGNALMVVMTGMGNDGEESIGEFREKGINVIAQDEHSCTVYGMPRCVVDRGYADIICPLEQIADQILSVVKRKGVPSQCR